MPVNGVNALLKTDIRQDQGRRKKISPEEFCKSFERSVAMQQTEVVKAAYQQGQYNLKPEYAHLAAEETEFFRKSPAQRDALCQR